MNLHLVREFGVSLFRVVWHHVGTTFGSVDPVRDCLCFAGSMLLGVKDPDPFEHCGREDLAHVPAPVQEAL